MSSDDPPDPKPLVSGRMAKRILKRIRLRLAGEPAPVIPPIPDRPSYRPRKPRVARPPKWPISGQWGPPPLKAWVEGRIARRNAARQRRNAARQDY